MSGPLPLPPSDADAAEAWAIDARMAEAALSCPACGGDPAGPCRFPDPPLAPAPVSWVAQVIADASGQWVGNALRFPTRSEADAYGLDLFSRWTAVREVRAVPSADPITHVWVGRLLAMPPAALPPEVTP